MGFGIEGDITKIYNTYVQKHPECSVLSPDAVYLRMKEEGVITQEQYNTIRKGLIFDFKSQKPETDGDWKSTFGLQTTQSKKTNSVKQNNAEQKTYYPVNKDKSDSYILYKMNSILYSDKYGFIHIHEGNAQDLIKYLNKDNIYKFLNIYKEKHNDVSFTEYLSSKGYDSKNKDKEKLLNHIEKLLYEKSFYNPHQKVTNAQIKNDNYTSQNIYDVQYNGKKVFINNKTTGKKSVLDFDKLLKNIKDPAEKISHMENMQKLPAEILEFYANEGVTIGSQKELLSYNKKSAKDGRIFADGFYNINNEKIALPFYTDINTYIHEIMHAVDYNDWGNAESDTKELKDAFELGLRRYETAGYTRFIDKKQKNNNQKASYYFSKDAHECWSKIGEMLYGAGSNDIYSYGVIPSGMFSQNIEIPQFEDNENEILKQFWPEMIELVKQKIAVIQNKPANERYS